MVLNLRGSNIDWLDMSKIIDACAEHVRTYYPTYTVFAIQYYGECWTGASAGQTYNKYGESSNCYEAGGTVGRDHTFYAYRLR